MFDSLLESQPVRERKATQTVFSIVIHTCIFAGAIQLTRATAQPGRRHPADVEIPLIAHHEPPALAHLTRPASSPTPLAPSFLTIAPPLVVPNAIPAIDMTQTYDPSRYKGIGTENGPPADIGDRIRTDSMDLSYSRAEVDTPAEYVSGPSPRFPSALRTAGIEGSVLLRFVVGADGRAEAASMHVVESTNRAFEDPAIAAVSGSTFKPGTIRGRAVRQVVEQSVRFQLTPGG